MSELSCSALNAAYPLRVIRVVLTERRALPVYPDKQTSSESVGMSQRCQYATNMRLTLEGRARRFTPAGFFNWMVRLSLSRCSLYRASGTDLCEHRQHVEVVRGVLDLTTLDLDDLAGRHLDRLVRGRNGTCWCL